MALVVVYFCPFTLGLFAADDQNSFCCAALNCKSNCSSGRNCG